MRTSTTADTRVAAVVAIISAARLAIAHDSTLAVSTGATRNSGRALIFDRVVARRRVGAEEGVVGQPAVRVIGSTLADREGTEDSVGATLKPEPSSMITACCQQYLNRTANHVSDNHLGD